LVVLLAALIACKSGKPSGGTATTAAPPSPPPKKLPYRPGAGELRGVCDGKGVPKIEEKPRDKASAAVFVKADPEGKLEQLPYAEIVGYNTGIAPSEADATLVACIEVTKKKKTKDCVMEPLDPTKMGGTLTLYSWKYSVTLRDAKTSKVLSEKTVERDDKKCPPIHGFKQSQEDLLPPFGTSASIAVTNYRDGK